MKNGYLSLSEIQCEEKLLLKNLIQFLEEHNIKYYVFYGTFLGAVRHKGFIPWDDDIDITIPRPDYNRFIEILKANDNKINSKNIVAEGFELGSGYWPFIKVLNKDIVTEGDCNDKFLWVDVFPVDGVKSKNNFRRFMIDFYRFIFYIKRFQLENVDILKLNISKKYLKKFVSYFLKNIEINSIVSKYIKLCTKYNFDECDYFCDNIWGYTDILFDKNKMIDKEYEFEDILVNGLEDYDYFLSDLYGKDYMELPPEDKRVTHSFKARRINK